MQRRGNSGVAALMLLVQSGHAADCDSHVRNSAKAGGATPLLSAQCGSERGSADVLVATEKQGPVDAASPASTLGGRVMRLPVEAAGA